MTRRLLPLLVSALLFGTAIGLYAEETDPIPESPPPQSGKASYYSDRLKNRPTASGEPYRPEKLTAAHRRLPFGTMVRVTRPKTGKSVVVRINDRGPYAGGRIIDLSRKAAEALGIVRAGVARVTVEVISLGE